MILPGSHHDPASHRADLHLEGSATAGYKLAPWYDLPGSHHDPASNRADLHLEGSAAADLMLAPVRLLMLSTFIENKTFFGVLGPGTRREFINRFCDIYLLTIEHCAYNELYIVLYIFQCTLCTVSTNNDMCMVLSRGNQTTIHKWKTVDSHRNSVKRKPRKINFLAVGVA